MIHGIDTDFLIAAEIRDHLFHAPAERLLDRLLANGSSLAIAPQTLAEFIHVVTDPRRLREPLSMAEAIGRAEFWWQAEEVLRVYPNDSAGSDFLVWLRDHRLGRKRLLDTLLAATYAANGIETLITNNERDFKDLSSFTIVTFRD